MIATGQDANADPRPGDGMARAARARGCSEEQAMRWYHYAAYFLGGAFLSNAVPHFVSGVTGHPFQSPFASPPGEGLSSATVTVLWGLLNLVIGYLLVCRVGSFELRRISHIVPLGLGVLAIAMMAARTFGRFYGGLG